jgi:hypothetical protein
LYAAMSDSFSGRIDVFKYSQSDFVNKVSQVQIHSNPITSMKLNYDNTTLVTSCTAGVLAFINVKSNEIRS